jgi:HEAT repeat protein
MRNHLVSWLDGHKWFKSKVKLGPSAEVSKSRALEAITCLGAAGQPALSDILPLMTNQSRAVKIRAFHALASISPATAAVKPFLPALMQALGDQEWTMRLAALNALAALQPPPPEATSVFIRLLKDANGMVSDAAMNYLVLQTNTAVIPVLDKDLHEKDSYAVTKAISRIAVFGAAAGGSEPRLRQLLNDPIFTVREAATNALAAMTGQSMSRSAPAENADITFNFPGMPVEYLLSQYEAMTGKKVAMAARPKSGQMVSFITVRPLTKSEALTLFEEVLKEQAGLIIVHGKDGSLTAVAKPQ